MKTHRRHCKVFAALACAAGYAALFSGAVPVAHDQPFFFHTVGKGESISLLCIEYYGHYEKNFNEPILLDNPLIKDINVIFPGQKVKLRNPDFKSAGTDTQPPVVIEKKVNAVQGVVTFIEGPVTIIEKGESAEKTLAVNTVVFPGDSILTGPKAKVELIINRESVVRMNENTRIKIEQLRNSGNETGKTLIRFPLGAVWTKMKTFREKLTRFELQLPTATAGVHGTVYQATVQSDNSAEVKVYSGEVAVKGSSAGGGRGDGMEAGEVSGPEEIEGPHEVSMEEWTVIVREMQRIRISGKGEAAKAETFRKNPSDSWEQWNEERDRRIAELFSRAL
jgi:hypothetical protein